MGNPVIEIMSCLVCPRFETIPTRHWLAGGKVLYRYRCKEADRDITPDDGVFPPPKWCPKRKAVQ